MFENSPSRWRSGLKHFVVSDTRLRRLSRPIQTPARLPAHRIARSAARKRHSIFPASGVSNHSPCSSTFAENAVIRTVPPCTHILPNSLRAGGHPSHNRRALPPACNRETILPNVNDGCVDVIPEERIKSALHLFFIGRS